MDKMVNRFLAWPLPQSVCSDICVTDNKYQFQRIGTNLLTASEALQMIEYLFAGHDIRDRVKLVLRGDSISVTIDGENFLSLSIAEILKEQNLRDEFAGIALQGILASGIHQNEWLESPCSAYQIADEMLKARTA